MNTRALKSLAATKLLPLLLLLVLPAMAQAQGSTDPNGWDWDYTNNFTAVIIEGYEGANTVVTIPSTINANGVNLPVTGIDAEALEDYTSLTSVTIPNSVTSIGEGAFNGCTGLISVTIGTNITTIGDDAFEDCTGLKNITLPNSLTSIGDYVFDDCYSLTSVTIPASVTSIGYEAFFKCYDLASVTIGTNVTSIGEFAFSGCTNLTSVTIPASVTYIGEAAFYYCTRLTSVTIGSGGDIDIGSYTFEDCYSLMAVYFQGNSPTPANDVTVFAGDSKGIVYYLPATTGWGTMFDGLPTMTNLVVGSVVQIVGTVTVTHTNNTQSPLHVGDTLSMGDTIQTSAGSAVNIAFKDNTTFAVSEDARMSIDQFIYNSNTQTGSGLWNLLQGVFVYTSGLIGKQTDPTNVNIDTPVGSIGIRGTQFISEQDPCSSTQTVYLIEGELAITPLATPGVTNICDAPVSIFITASSVTTAALNQTMYNSISNQVFQNTGIVTFPSWLEQYFGCTNNPDAAPNADPSGDGQDNYVKFLTGMNPTNSASYFHILSATPEGNNLLVTWLCGGGRTNVLQATTNLGGSWSNISPNIVLAGSGDNVANYLDVGAVTNTLARFYRVLLLP